MTTKAEHVREVVAELKRCGSKAGRDGLARRLAASAEPGVRWVGKDALRDLTKPAVLRRLAARGAASAPGAPGRRW